MRYHYQASVINLAKEAVTSSSGPARAKHGMQERAMHGRSERAWLVELRSWGLGVSI